MNSSVARTRKAAGSMVLCIPIVLAVLLLSAACDPPGKPRAEMAGPDILDFDSLFNVNCSGCHGTDGKNGPGRILNDPLYLALVPRETLKDVIIHGRPGTSMPAWAKSEGGPMTPAQIDALVDGMEKRWAKPVDFKENRPPAYQQGDAAGDPEAGRKLFLRSCFMCHGPGARVGSVTDPSYLSLVSDQMLRTSVIVGRHDLGMPDYRNLKAGKALDDAEVTDIVAFLISKRPPAETARLRAAAVPSRQTTQESGAQPRQGTK